jgi:hypothetical protein
LSRRSTPPLRQRSSSCASATSSVSRTKRASAPPWTGLLRGEVPPGGSCDVSTLAKEARVDRTAFYGARPYAHLRKEFETRLARIREAGDPIGPSEGQISRLKDENAKLKARLAQSNSEIDDLTDFRTTALARLAAQHEEIIRLRSLVTTPRSNITRLPGPRQKIIVPC